MISDIGFHEWEDIHDPQRHRRPASYSTYLEELEITKLKLKKVKQQTENQVWKECKRNLGY